MVIAMVATIQLYAKKRKRDKERLAAEAAQAASQTEKEEVAEQASV